MVLSDQDLPLDRAVLPFSPEGDVDTDIVRTLQERKKEGKLNRQQI